MESSIKTHINVYMSKYGAAGTFTYKKHTVKPCINNNKMIYDALHHQPPTNL